MAKFEFGEMSLRELSGLKEGVASAIERAKVREAEAFRAEVGKLAAARGLTVAEVLGTVSSRKPRKLATGRKLQPLYDPVARKRWEGAGRYPEGFDKSRAVPAA